MAIFKNDIMIKTIPWKTLGVFSIGLILGLTLGINGAVKAVVKVFDSRSVSTSLNKPTNQNNTSIEFKDNKFKKNQDTISISLSQEPVTVQVVKNDSCFISRNKFNTFSRSLKKRIEKSIK